MNIFLSSFMTIFGVFSIFSIIWGINCFITGIFLDKKIAKMTEEHPYDMNIGEKVEMMLRDYHPLKSSTWFGFKHWFFKLDSPLNDYDKDPWGM